MFFCFFCFLFFLFGFVFSLTSGFCFVFCAFLLMDSLGFFVHSFSQIHFITHLTNIIFKEKEIHKEKRLHTDGSAREFVLLVLPENSTCSAREFILSIMPKICTSSSTREFVLPILPENLYC